MDDTTTGLAWGPALVVATLGIFCALVIGRWPTVGGVLAGIHLGAIVGWLPARSLRVAVPSGWSRAGLAVAMSLACSALAFQVLFWFGYATAPVVVILATLYSLSLGWLMPGRRAGAGWRVEGAS